MAGALLPSAGAHDRASFIFPLRLAEVSRENHCILRSVSSYETRYSGWQSPFVLANCVNGGKIANETSTKANASLAGEAFGYSNSQPRRKKQPGLLNKLSSTD